MLKYFIEVVQRLPQGDPERIKRVSFETESDARLAYAQAKNFWVKSERTAVEVEGKYHTIVVSTNVLASVSLHISNQAYAKKKKKK